MTKTVKRKPPAGRRQRDGWPTELIIAGVRYRVRYLTAMSEVNNEQRSALWGECDGQLRELRVWVGRRETQRQPADVLQTLLHEMVHAVIEGNRLLNKAKLSDDDAVDALGVGIADTLVRNGMLRLPALTPKGQTIE